MAIDYGEFDSFCGFFEYIVPEGLTRASGAACIVPVRRRREPPARATPRRLQGPVSGGNILGRTQRPEPGRRSAARAHRRAQCRHPAHQCEPRRGHRAARGRRQRPRTHRRALRRDRHHRRGGPAAAAGHHHLGPRPGRGTAGDGLARRDAAVRAPARPGVAASRGGPRGVRPLARALAGPHPVPLVPGHADAPSRPRYGELLPRGEGRRGGVHRRGRGGAGAVRRAGGHCHRQRAGAPRRAARAGGSGGAGRDLAGRRGGPRRAERQSAVAQPGGGAHARRPARPRRLAGGPARGADRAAAPSRLHSTPSSRSTSRGFSNGSKTRESHFPTSSEKSSRRT